MSVGEWTDCVTDQCPLPVLLALLPPMKPRYYSVAGFGEYECILLTNICFTQQRQKSGVIWTLCLAWCVRAPFGGCAPTGCATLLEGAVAFCDGVFTSCDLQLIDEVFIWLHSERLVPPDEAHATPFPRLAVLQQLRGATGIPVLDTLVVPVLTREPTSFRLPEVVVDCVSSWSNSYLFLFRFFSSGVARACHHGGSRHGGGAFSCFSAGWFRCYYLFFWLICADLSIIIVLLIAGLFCSTWRPLELLTPVCSPATACTLDAAFGRMIICSRGESGVTQHHIASTADNGNSELAGYVQRGTLHELHVAASREADKKYVQHIIDEHAEAIADALLRQHGHFYVCGDARSMAPQVNNRSRRV
jgi:hypothetical protein